jgi:peptidoglycan hydrolase-like protein with peptidoglycan-binding domain
LFAIGWASLVLGATSAQPGPPDTPQQGDTPQAHSSPAAPEDDSRMVRRVEEQLQKAGYDVEIDGQWDDATKAAVTEFQKAEGLNATGLLDIDTIEALGIDQ